MNHPDKETLSQLMDGEWQDIDSQARITELCSDSELKATWARYHLIRDVMKNESVKVDTDIASRVWAALEDEPAHTNVRSIGVDIGADQQATTSSNRGTGTSGFNTAADARQPTQTRWLSRSAFGGLAVAASVALATVFGLNVMLADSGDQAQIVAALPAAPNSPTIPGQVLPQIELVANRGTYWVNSSSGRNANKEERLNMFLSQHIEYSPTTSHQGMLPYSRLVGYDDIGAGQ